MYCFFYGETCQVEPDKKRPDCFVKNSGILYRTSDRGKDEFGRKRKLFKEVTLEVQLSMTIIFYK